MTTDFPSFIVLSISFIKVDPTTTASPDPNAPPFVPPEYNPPSKDKSNRKPCKANQYYFSVSGCNNCNAVCINGCNGPTQYDCTPCP